MKTSRSLPWSQLKAGIVIIVALFLLAVGILQLGGNSGLFTGTYKLQVHLENTYGLKVGSTVRLAGLDIGNVDDIDLLAEPDDKRIAVTLNLQDKYQDRIRKDSMVSIKTLGLLGDKYVEISVGSPGKQVIEEGGLIMGVEQAQMERVLTQAGSGLEGLKLVLDQLRDILGDVVEGRGTVGLLLKDPELYQDLDKAIKGIEVVATDLHGAKGTLGKLIQEPELYENMLEVSAKAREVADKLNRGSLARLSEDKDFYENLRDVSANLEAVSTDAKSLMSNLESGNLAKLSKDQTLYARIEKVSAQLDGIMSRLEKGEGSAGKLLTDDELYVNMNRFFEHADALVVDVKENPDRYLQLSLF